MLNRMWSQWITPPQLLVLQNCTVILEFSMAIPQTIANQSTSKSMILLLDLYPKHTQSQEHLLNNIDSCITHNNQNLETT